MTAKVVRVTSLAAGAAYRDSSGRNEQLPGDWMEVCAALIQQQWEQGLELVAVTQQEKEYTMFFQTLFARG